MRTLLLVLSFTLNLTSFSALTQWYEAQGEARIINNNNDAARAIAMENALKSALLVAGASVSSVQAVINGVLTQDEISIRASGSVNSLALIEETYNDNVLYVKIRADIFPQDKQCFSADYRKPILLTRSHISNRQHANVGEIYALDAEIIRQLANKFNNQGAYVNAKLAIQNKSRFSRLHHTMQYEQIKKLVMSLADHTDSQFVMFTDLPDLSLSTPTNQSLKFWEKDQFDRYFKINVFVYNGSNGELLFEKQYHNKAPWQFDKRESVDIASNTFWLSEYGHVIKRSLDNITTDIDEMMMCQPTRGKIVSVSGDTVRFNLGENQGVKVGDEFSLLHANNFINDQGKTYAGFNVSAFKVKVVSTSKESATATTINKQLLGNIQINDIAVRY